jgi:valyl-tRNA synthetase
MALEFMGEIPFEDVHITAIIQAPDGRRMSKSLGTGIDPLDLIEGGRRPPVFAVGAGDPGAFPAYGADAVRWGLLAMSSGQDVRFSEDKVGQGQQLTNKLWNAARLILLRIDPGTRPAIAPRRVEDRWILSRLERAKASVGSRIESYDFSHAALELYDFVYGELCDWYLELVKPRLYAGEEAVARTLLHVLEQTLALAHPIIPFVTEEIYSHMPGADGLLAAGLPERSGGTTDEAAEESMSRVFEAVRALRGWRDHAGVRPGARLAGRLAAEGYEETAGQVAQLARIALDGPDGGEPVQSVPVPGGVVEILAGENLDLEAAERKRAAARKRLEQEISQAKRKLANEGFVTKAPAEIVEAERQKLGRLRTELEAL